MLLLASETPWYAWALSGIGAVLIPIAATALARVTRNYRANRQAPYKATMTSLGDRVGKVEVRQTDTEANMSKVLQFIEGSEDPFTKEHTGGLLSTLKRLENRLDEGKATP